MAVTDEEWASIANAIDRAIATNIGRRRDYFMIGTVNKRDEKKNLIWIEEFDPDTKIPIFTFDYNVVYYDESPRGATVGGFRTYKKNAEITPKVPEIGDKVLIAREMGNDLLPRCLGVLRSKDWINDLEDD